MIEFGGMTILKRAVVAAIVASAVWTTASAQRTVDLDAATIADVNAAASA